MVQYTTLPILGGSAGGNKWMQYAFTYDDWGYGEYAIDALHTGTTHMHCMIHQPTVTRHHSHSHPTRYLMYFFNNWQDPFISTVHCMPVMIALK